MNFSMMFRTRLNILPIIPTPLNMPRRFSMSDLSIVLVSKVAATNTITKNITPIISRITLEKASCEMRM